MSPSLPPCPSCCVHATNQKPKTKNCIYWFRSDEEGERRAKREGGRRCAIKYETCTGKFVCHMKRRHPTLSFTHTHNSVNDDDDDDDTLYYWAHLTLDRTATSLGCLYSVLIGREGRERVTTPLVLLSSCYFFSCSHTHTHTEQSRAEQRKESVVHYWWGGYNNKKSTGWRRRAAGKKKD